MKGFPLTFHEALPGYAPTELIEATYDGVVEHAIAQAGGNCLNAQDTSWQGYPKIPEGIVEGYTTLMAEVVAHYRASLDRPLVVAVEPENAPSLTSGLAAGEPLQVPTLTTVMSGLNCGTV